MKQTWCFTVTKATRKATMSIDLDLVICWPFCNKWWRPVLFIQIYVNWSLCCFKMFSRDWCSREQLTCYYRSLPYKSSNVGVSIWASSKLICLWMGIPTFPILAFVHSDLHNFIDFDYLLYCICSHGFIKAQPLSITVLCLG